jgi:hypothetical protein
VIYSGPEMSSDQLAKLKRDHLSSKRSGKAMSSSANASPVSVEMFAKELCKNVDLFIDQLEAAGLGRRSPSDHLSEKDKSIFLRYLMRKS